MKQEADLISILIIVDNPGDQLLLKTHLDNSDLPISTITIASTIAEGLMYLQHESFSLVFLDYYLPDSIGLESYTELSKISPKIPVIILSELPDTALSLEAISMGAQDFLSKDSFSGPSLERSVWYSIERKRNIELIKENSERYDIMSKATNDVIWDWDIITNKVKWTGQGLKNYLAPTVTPGNIPDHFWVNALHPDDRRKVVTSIYRSIARGESSNEIDYRFLKNDGTYAYINSRGYVIKDEGQKVTRMIGSLQDITARKNAEIETQQARTAAEDARKTQEQFLATISDEIRTPMNDVIGMTQLLAGTPLTKDQKEYVETIKESADSLTAIINAMLDFTKLDSKKTGLTKPDHGLRNIKNDRTNQPGTDEKGALLKHNNTKVQGSSALK